MRSKTEQERVTPAGRVIEMVILKMLHLLCLHLHECGLVEDMSLFRGKIHNVGRSGCLANLSRN